MGHHENLMKKITVVLESRDYKDSVTIFRFPISNHKKYYTFKQKKFQNLAQFGDLGI